MINKSSLEAIKALAELAKLPQGQFEGAGTIAHKINAPANYLGKLLQQLAGYGLVISQKGLNGGFRLGKSSREISLFDIVECLEDVAKWSACFLGRRQCSSASPCRLHHQWKEVRETNVNFLKGITLADF